MGRSQAIRVGPFRLPIPKAGLEAELTAHLGNDKLAPEDRDGGNSRSRTRPKTVLAEVSLVKLNLARDLPVKSAESTAVAWISLWLHDVAPWSSLTAEPVPTHQSRTPVAGRSPPSRNGLVGAAEWSLSRWHTRRYSDAEADPRPVARSRIESATRWH